jgi:GNAT superfamily N-acetyltransferase
VEVVRATVRDVDVCLAIQRAAEVASLQHVFPRESYPFPDGEIRANWLAALTDPEVEVYLAVDAGEPVGTVALGHGYLRMLYVMPSAWRRGVGDLLHELALDRLRRANVEAARLWTLAENCVARSFYEKRGWRLTGAARAVPFPPRPIELEYARSTRRRIAVRDALRGER